MAILTAVPAGHDVCSLTVVGPHGLVDLAAPVTVPVAGLLATFLRYVGGPDATDGDWVLRRLGGAVLDPDGTPMSLGLHDGDVLHALPAALL
ncbi:EsaB/YukD family protein [Kitasatospora sp. NBC_00085]|uniref:EsaB/YukD family protein n=1 Tax=unclassified Kitasatospora TaxID=2633591 RepID=UPI003246530B